MICQRLSAWFGADHSNVVKDVLSGKERIIPLVDVQRHPFQALSACHFAALNFVRVAFKHISIQRARGGPSLSIARWLSTIMERHGLEEMLSPCEQLTGEQAIQLQVMQRTPLFEGTLRHVATKHGNPSMILFKQSLRQMQLQASPVLAIVVSRNAGAMVCLRLRENSRDVFLILDFALATPEHDRGLALVINTSLEQTAARLSGNLPMGNHFLTRDKQWQAQLFTNCTISMFMPADGFVLSSQAEELAVNESITLLRAIGGTDDRNREWGANRSRNRRQGDQTSESSHGELWGSRSAFPLDLAGIATTSHDPVPVGGSTGEGPSTRVATLRPKTTFTPYEQSKRHCRIFFSGDEPSSPTSSSSSSETFDEEAYFECVICFESIPETEGIRLLPCAHAFCSDCLTGHVCSKIEERKFPVFCPLCMTEERNARPSGEELSFVRPTRVVADENYMQSFPRKSFGEWEYRGRNISSGLNSKWRTYMCEYIAAGKRRCGKTICRAWNSCSTRCRRSAFVEKDEYEESDELVCRFPGCGHTWCKNCQQTVLGGSSGPKHSCDGREELDYLVRQMGWKYCPKCRTPVQKNGGCNHMTCATPGCNTHFCYRCGKQITRASIPFLVRSAVNAHFKQCTL